MTTYYAAQLGIALSVVDSKANYTREIEGNVKKQQTPQEESIETTIHTHERSENIVLRQRLIS